MIRALCLPLLLLLVATAHTFVAALIHYKAHPVGQVIAPISAMNQQAIGVLPQQAAAENYPTQQQQQQQQQQPSQISTAQQPDQLQLPAAMNNNQLGGTIDSPPLRSNSQRSIADGQQTLHHPIFRFQGYALNSTSIKLIWNLNMSAPQPPEQFDIDYGPIPDATSLISIPKLNKTTRDYTVSQLTPDTPYQFMLKSSRGELNFEPKLLVLRTPPANTNGMGAPIKQANLENPSIMPLGVKAEAKSNTTVQLSWTEPAKPDSLYNSLRVNIIRYFVNPSQYTPSAASTTTTTTTRANDTSGAGPVYHYLNTTNPRESRLIVQKLKPATEYAFAVKTTYWSPDMKKLFSQSGFSMDTVAKTFDLEPSPPRNFSIRVIKPTPTATANSSGKEAAKLDEAKIKQVDIKLELTWLPPESPNGQLRGYYLFYANDSNPDSWSRIEIDDPKVDNWHVTNVAPGVTYYFKMRAINQRGQSQDSDVRRYTAPVAQGQQNPNNPGHPPLAPSNLLMLIIICMVASLFLLFLIVSWLACRTRSSASSRKHRKGSLNTTTTTTTTTAAASSQKSANHLSQGVPKLNGFASTNSSSTVTARVGTLARRRTNNAINNNDGKPDFWISAMEQQQQQQQHPDQKSNMSEKGSNSDFNMAMVSIQRNSPNQFATTTQLAPTLPDYRQFSQQTSDPMQQQQQSHYHPGLQFASHTLGYDQMDNATASALMTLSKRQQQQMQKYQIQFAATGVNGPPSGLTMASHQQQAPSPHQQPPPPPPLNIEQQQQQHHHQSLYGTHQPASRSQRLHQRTLYDPVSGSFLQSQDTGGPPNYSSHMHGGAQTMLANHQTGQGFSINPLTQQINSNTLQFHQHHPHQSNTLLSRRSTNTLRSFQTSNGQSTLYGQLAGFAPPPQPNSIGGGSIQQPALLQSHQAVINQLNNSTYPSLPLKHVSAVRPQIMSSLEDQIEMEMAEKEPTIASLQSQDSQHQQQQQ